MSESKVDLYLCGVKGYAAAKYIVENHSELIANVTLAPDTGTVDDPIEDIDRKSTRLNSSHSQQSRMPSSA